MNGTIATYVSRDNGNTFDPPVIAQRGYGTFVNNVEVSVKFDTSQVSSYTGSIYLCYTHQYNPDFFGGSVMFFQRSQDGGITWGEITVNITGVIYVGYIVTNPVNGYQVIVSFNGGTAFSSSLPVSSVVPVPVVTIGNFIDVTIVPNSGFFAVWTDALSGFQQIYGSDGT